MLILFRALQGLGGGGLIVSTMAAIGDVVPPRERGRYQGFFGAVFGLASVIGPLLGGFFTTYADLALDLLREPAARRRRVRGPAADAPRPSPGGPPPGSTTSAPRCWPRR